MGAPKLVNILQEELGRSVALSYVKKICDDIGDIAAAKEESWNYALPEIEEPVVNVGVGLDGTCIQTLEDGWREAMVGSITLYGEQQKRLHTILIGATPEYGKETFLKRLETEITKVKAKFESANYVGIADGAKVNWSFLEKHTDQQVLDFYHASEYLTKTSKAIFDNDANEQRHEWLRQTNHNLKHKVGAAARIINELKQIDQDELSEAEAQVINANITYFTNNKARMSYAKFRKNDLPIGSGVTESACKMLIKQRLCNSGMRWKEKGAAAVISIRALTHTTGRWEQFWQKVDRYGIRAAA